MGFDLHHQNVARPVVLDGLLSAQLIEQHKVMSPMQFVQHWAKARMYFQPGHAHHTGDKGGKESRTQTGGVILIEVRTRPHDKTAVYP